MQAVKLSDVMPNGLCHALEGSGEPTELVIRVHLDVGVEVACGQAVGAGRQCCERLPHNALQKHHGRRYKGQEDHQKPGLPVT